MSAGLDLDFSGQLTASLNGLTTRIGQLCDYLDANRGAIQRVNQAFRQVEFAGQVSLTAGAGTLLDSNRFGCPLGYMWSVRRLTAQGFTAGTVTVYRDNTAGEPLALFVGAAAIVPQYYGKGDVVLKPMSQLAWGAAGITGTVSVWGVADQMESWLFPWYIGGSFPAD